jgi:3-dehydro-4-phosphotetronate decarboxylase
MIESALRQQLAMVGRSFLERGLTFGGAGNMSVRLEDGFLMTPTNASLGRLDPMSISKLTPEGELISGDPPTKESFLHLAVYEQRPTANAVVHLHPTHSVAVSCLADLDPADVLPPITPYYLMRVGRLPLIPYYPPGDRALADAVREKAKDHPAMLLANHGPVIAGTSLEAAVNAMEELEETAKLFFLLNGQNTRLLTAEQVAAVREKYPTK